MGNRTGNKKIREELVTGLHYLQYRIVLKR